MRLERRLEHLEMMISRLLKPFPLKSLSMDYIINKERIKFTVAGYHKFKKTGNINSVESSLKSHPLWVTLYFLVFL